MQEIILMTTTPPTARRLLLSGLIIALILTAAIILDGPPTLTNKVLAQVLAQGDASVLVRYGYYYGACSLPNCTYLPLIVRPMVMRSYIYLPLIVRPLAK